MNPVTVKEPIEKVFADDEMFLGEVKSSWDRDTLLNQECIFFLKDILALLDLDAAKVKKHFNEIDSRGECTWKVLGVGKTWNHWIVRMTVFSKYYRKNLVPRAKRIPKEWNGNMLLDQKGTFYLTEVCKHIPFTTHQIRYQAKKMPGSRAEIGVWKDNKLKLYLVDMVRFSKWVKKLWNQNANLGRVKT